MRVGHVLTSPSDATKATMTDVRLFTVSRREFDYTHGPRRHTKAVHVQIVLIGGTVNDVCQMFATLPLGGCSGCVLEPARTATQRTVTYSESAV